MPIARQALRAMSLSSLACPWRPAGYRHPENVELEWTGRGRKPKWVEAWLASGSTLENLLV